MAATVTVSPDAAYRLLWAGLVVAAAGAALWFAEFLPAWERLFR